MVLKKIFLLCFFLTMFFCNASSQQYQDSIRINKHGRMVYMDQTFGINNMYKSGVLEQGTAEHIKMRKARVNYNIGVIMAGIGTIPLYFLLNIGINSPIGVILFSSTAIYYSAAITFNYYGKKNRDEAVKLFNKKVSNPTGYIPKAELRVGLQQSGLGIALNF